MSGDSFPVLPARKPAARKGFFPSVLRLLKSFWLTELVLLFVVVYGLRAGWSTNRQWSDAFFFAAAFQVIIGGITWMAPPGEALDAASLRYLSNGDIPETRFEMVAGTLRRRQFSVRALIGGGLTVLISAIFLWI